MPTQYLVENDILDREILKLTDWHTEDLFASEGDEMITAGFSRVFCDPERFTDDEQEVMAQYGMGVLYEKSDDGTQIREVTPDLKERVLEDFYWPHQQRLCAAVNDQLRHFKKALIIDCHSYPSTPFRRDLDQAPDRPDFNIGTDPFHTSEKLVDQAVSFFQHAGYTIEIDRPYSGSLVPLEHYGINKNVQSIMLEVNRALYLEEPTNRRSARYPEIKKIVGAFIETLREEG